MPSKRPPQSSWSSARPPLPARGAPAGLLTQRPLSPGPNEPLARVHAKSPTWHPFLYRKRIGEVEGHPQPGDVVEVYHSGNELLGYGIYNPRAEIVVRMLRHGPQRPDDAFWQDRLQQAARLRRELLALDGATDAYRVVHAEGDGLSGIVVDRFGDTLSAEAFSLGMYQRSEALLKALAPLCGTEHFVVRPGPQVHGQEGFLAEPQSSPQVPRQVTINEFGTRFRVRFEGGHKTGFFCDQRENRHRLAQFCEGRSVLDLCCYTGGFAIQARRLGKAADVTGVDLDEDPLRLARENANLNQVRVHFVQADVFAFMRDMLQNGRQYDVVVLDPPKLIRSRRELEEGTRKHFDLNRLAMQLVRPGGLLLSCSCAGLLPESEFLRLLYAAARQAVPQRPAGAAAAAVRRPGRLLQVLARSGAAADHPVAANCPETEYLKAVWMRLE